MKCFTLFLLFSISCLIEGARILVIPVSFYFSHMLNMNAIAEELKNNGQEVYAVVEDAYAGREIQPWAEGVEVLSFRVENDVVDTYARNCEKSLIDGTDYSATEGLWRSFYSCRKMFDDKTFLEKIANLKFDLAIMEQQTAVSCTYLLPHIYKIPHVSVFQIHEYWDIPGTAVLPSFTDVQLMPLLEFLTEKGNAMDFKERLIQTAWYIFTNRWVHRPFFRLTGMFPEVNDVTLIEHFRSKGMVSENIQGYEDMIAETQLFILVNSGLTLHNTKPLYPNMISVDGMTIEEPKLLAKDINDLVHSAQDGVILVSYGATLQNISIDIIKTLLDMFRKRKELVFMRFSGSLKDTNISMPANVRFMKWLPQKDLLAHNKTKLLITHGGLHTIHEAIYHGVPMLCVPLSADQFSNARNLQAKGYGLSVRLSEFLSGKRVEEKLEEVIDNPSYRNKVKKAGQIMRHQPMTARQTAAFWIEHVLRFGGEHLKPSSIHLTWWQYFCLDTLGFITVFVVILVWVIYAMCKIVTKSVLKYMGVSTRAKKD